MRMINEIAQTAEPSEEVVEPLRGPGPEPSFRQNVGQQSSNPQSENPQGDGSATVEQSAPPADAPSNVAVPAAHAEAGVPPPADAPGGEEAHHKTHLCLRLLFQKENPSTAKT